MGRIVWITLIGRVPESAPKNPKLSLVDQKLRSRHSLKRTNTNPSKIPDYILTMILGVNLFLPEKCSITTTF